MGSRRLRAVFRSRRLDPSEHRTCGSGAGVFPNGFLIEFAGRDQLIMTFFYDFHFVALQCEFKKRNHSVVHELGRNGPTKYSFELLSGKAKVLGGLDDANLVFAAFGLDGNYVVTAALI